MTEPVADYTVLSQVHGSRWDERLQQVETGWTIQVQDLITGTVVPVFVPDGFYNADNARTLIEAALEPVRAVHQLGQ